MAGVVLAAVSVIVYERPGTPLAGPATGVWLPVVLPVVVAVASVVLPVVTVSVNWSLAPARAVTFLRAVRLPP